VFVFAVWCVDALAFAAPETRADIADALGIQAGEIVSIRKGRDDLLVHISPAAFGMVSAHVSAALARFECRGVIVTAECCPPHLHAPQSDRARFSSRFFAPRCGIPEDPVTGSAHCLLAPYWAAALGIPERERFYAFQASPRGGHLGLELCDGRVKLLGRAKTTLEGRLLPSPAPDSAR
jgi:predicted PhzF superfamily epimerase YddE/YHI9